MSDLQSEIKIVLLLIKKDIKESLKNRTAVMIIMLPLFASLMFSLVGSQEIVRNFEIGISGNSAEELVSYIDNNFKNFSMQEYQTSERGRVDAASGNIDAFIEYRKRREKIEDRYNIFLDSRDSVNYFILRENISMLLKRFHGIEEEVSFSFNSAAEIDTASSILPVWLTVTITMIGLMLISGSLSEEKDNNTLAALLVSRVKASQIIISKSLFALLLTIIASSLMGALNGAFSISPARLSAAFIIITAGSMVFSGLGLMISLFTDSQSSARSISTVIYFPIIFPALVADVSPLTQRLARFFPSYYLYRALDKILVYSGSNFSIVLELSFLALFAIIFYLIIYVYLRRTDSIAE